MKKTVVLHIGLPKTATTSFQHFSARNRGSLRRQGSDYFISEVDHGYNHIELYLASIRGNIATMEALRRDFDLDELQERARERIKIFLAHSKVLKHIFSCEGLSFLRTDSEMERLKLLFPSGISFRVIFVERDKAEWLESWKRQILGKPGRQLSNTPNSTMYVEPDTWLTDFEGLKETWSRHFDDFTCLQYTPDGMVKKLYNAMGLVMPDQSAELRIKDRSQGSSSRRRLVERASSKMKRMLNDFDYWARYDRHL
jgi:hypothetical protein